MANEGDELQQDQQSIDGNSPNSNANASNNVSSAVSDQTKSSTTDSIAAPDLGERSNKNNKIGDGSNSDIAIRPERTLDVSASLTSPASVDVTLGNSCARGQLTDLVADVCLNGVRADSTVVINDATVTLPVGFGDCTNIRATLGVLGFSEGLSNRKTEQTAVDSSSTAPSTNTSATSPALHVPTAPTQNSSTFSFKHFLSSSSGAFTAPSTTVTSLDPVCSVAASSALPITTATSSSVSSQKSTGARPKVPQSASLVADSAAAGGRSSCDNGLGVPSGDAGGFGVGSTRMKRSPRFSSFDSQASLAEYASGGRGISGGSDDCGAFAGSYSATSFRLYPLIGADSSSPSQSTASKRLSNNSAASSGQNTFPNARTNSGVGGSDLERQRQQQYVPRSYSNYEMPMPPSTNVSSVSTPPTSTNSNRPNRLSLHPPNPAKLKLDLPIDSAAANVLGPSDFAPASAAALPDFVQDHWMDALYLHEMHLNSPRNSPTRDFGGAAAAAKAAWCDIGAVGGACGGADGGNTSNSGAVGGFNAAVGGLATAPGNMRAHDILTGGGGGIPAPGNGSTAAATAASASKMLPDFLSDGPIIHSSQRLADVAVGLPSNSIGSPEDPPFSQQLSNLRLENERLQRELSETRTALCDQTRRANDLERQLQEENRRRTSTPTAQQVMRLKQQLSEMAEETELLRRENEALREDGAVGGYSDSGNSHRPERRYARPAPTRSQQISQALLRAASNAESNLRQLLTGVDNLRQMAADIEDSALRLDYDGNSDIFSDFVDDCDGFEDFSGGPAL